MAIEDDGELIVLAPALVEFGEDKEIDRLIRKYGYVGTPQTLKSCDENEELRNNLSAAAHLIHGSSEGRFSITYCPGKRPENLTRAEIESVGFNYADIDEVTANTILWLMEKKFFIFQILHWDCGHLRIDLNFSPLIP